jgi:hypothetical protein
VVKEAVAIAEFIDHGSLVGLEGMVAPKAVGIECRCIYKNRFHPGDSFLQQPVYPEKGIPY